MMKRRTFIGSLLALISSAFITCDNKTSGGFYCDDKMSLTDRDKIGS